jgi:hypothetical protein
MTDRQDYQEDAEIEVEAFANQIARTRERLGGHGEGAAEEEEEMLTAMERILERAQETTDRMKETDDPEEWDAVRCQMDGILSEMRNAARTMGFTLPD